MKRLPRRWFDWRRKHWRVPADPRLAKPVEALLERFPELEAEPEVLAWLSDSDRWRAVVSVVAHEGAGAFVLRTLSGDPPAGAAERHRRGRATASCCPSSATRRPADASSRAPSSTTSPASAPASSRRAASRPRRSWRSRSATTASPRSRSSRSGTTSRRGEFKRLPEAHPVARPGRFFARDACWGVAVPADPALSPAPRGLSWRSHPQVHVEEPRARAARRAARRARARVGDGGALATPRTPSSTGSSSAASCTRSSAPACATRSSAAARSSPTSRGSARPCRRWPRSRSTTPSRRSWSARRA